MTVIQPHQRQKRIPVRKPVEAPPAVEVVHELPKPVPRARPVRTPRTPVVVPREEPVLVHVPVAEIEAIIMTPIELRKREIQRIFPHVALEDIFIDKGNGVELFRRPGSFTYSYRAPIEEGEGITMNTDTKTFKEWVKALGYEWAPGRENIVKGYMTKNEALNMVQRYTGDGSLQYKGGN